MSTQPNQIDLQVITGFEDQRVIEAAQSLGRLLSNTPEHQTFLQTLKEVNHDENVQRFSVQLRQHDRALQWGQGDLAEHNVAIQEIHRHLEALPNLRAYREAEKTIVQMCRELDQIICQASGVEFAPNAKQSGCGCGG
jgi:cell fate (sporulation/competence/biofilm development) regulator YlbF (YheA/YmcA/DUF963 family)